MDEDQQLYEDEQRNIRRHRRWYVLVLILLVLSFLFHYPIFFLAAFCALVYAVVPELWHRRGLHHLTFNWRLDQQHLGFGEEVTLSITIENRKLLPVPWLQIDSHITPALTRLPGERISLEGPRKEVLSDTWLFWPLQRVTRDYHLPCLARGLHAIGPMHVSSSDLFGWFERDAQVALQETVLVYPIIMPLDALDFSHVYPLGEYTSLLPLFEDPLRVAGVREYTPGDDPRRIHWKASAHTGVLHTKIYEHSSVRRLLLLLDIYNYSRSEMRTESELQEFAITVAASLAVWALGEGYSVGLVTNCAMAVPAQEHPTQSVPASSQEEMIFRPVFNVSVPYSQGAEHYDELLSVLASLLPQQHVPVERVIENQDAMFMSGSTVLVVSTESSLNERMLDLLLDLRKRDISVHLVHIGSTEETLLAEEFLPVHYVGGKERWHDLVTTFADREGSGRKSVTDIYQLD